jgi:hypothetical protein
VNNDVLVDLADDRMRGVPDTEIDGRSGSQPGTIENPDQS